MRKPSAGGVLYLRTCASTSWLETTLLTQRDGLLMEGAALREGADEGADQQVHARMADGVRSLVADLQTPCG